MNKEELENRLHLLFKNKTDRIIEVSIQLEGMNQNQLVSEDVYRRIKTRAMVEWDDYLNKFDIKRREYHLKEKDPPRNHIRIGDTLLLWGTGQRWLDIPIYVAQKFLVLGLP